MIMDYAFGEQAYESMDELLTTLPRYRAIAIPFTICLSPASTSWARQVSWRGSRVIIMIPDAHIFEGTADNYPLQKRLLGRAIRGAGPGCLRRPHGHRARHQPAKPRDPSSTSSNSSWQCRRPRNGGRPLPEGHPGGHPHPQKRQIPSIKLRYAYYASDNPLVTGHTLASGSLGVDGVKPTYLITIEILKQIFSLPKRRRRRSHHRIVTAPRPTPERDQSAQK